MDMTRGIQRAIYYVDDNILVDLDLEEVARKAYVSPYHFQRIFLLLSGMTLGTYIRNRRLSLAAAELQSGSIKIIDLAMKYGYDAPESFSRAFERFHGILPSAARAKGAKVNAMSPLSIKVSLTGGSVLTYSIEEMKGFRLIVKSVRQVEDYDAPAQLWRQCSMDGTIEALIDYSTSPNKEIIGLTDGSTYDGTSQMYYVGTIYDEGEIPEGFEIKEIPARTWIKFLSRDMTERHAEAEIWRRIYSEYFPASEYSPNEYQMVVYLVGTDDYAQEMGEIWVEVRKQMFVADENV